MTGSATPTHTHTPHPHPQLSQRPGIPQGSRVRSSSKASAVCGSHTHCGHATSPSLAGVNNKSNHGWGGAATKMKASSLCALTAADRTFDVPGSIHQIGSAPNSWDQHTRSSGVPQVLTEAAEHKTAPTLWAVYVQACQAQDDQLNSVTTDWKGL